MLSGKAGTAAAATPGSTSDEPTRPAATSPATTALRRPDGRASGDRPAVPPVRLRIFMWCSCVPCAAHPGGTGVFRWHHGSLYLRFGTATRWGSGVPQYVGSRVAPVTRTGTILWE